MKAGRSACLRCGEPLSLAAETTAPPASAFWTFFSRWRVATIAAGILGPAALALVTVAPRTREDVPHMPAPAPAASAASRAGGGDADATPVTGPIAVGQPGF